jgi:hypothetical protein
MAFRKTQAGRMGILTIPQGTRMYRRSTKGKTFERCKKEFDILALPSHSNDGEDAYSFKLYDQYWYVIKGDVEQTEER